MIALRTKKGISEVVAAVLLVLLAVSAAAVLLNFVKPFVKNGLESSSQCLPYKDYYTFEQNFENQSGTYNFNCYKQQGGRFYISAMVKAGVGLSQDDLANLNGFLLVFNRVGGSSTVRAVEFQPVNKSENTLWRLDDSASTYLDINKAGETLVYVFNADQSYRSVQIYPVLKNGATCDASDEIDLKQCGVGVSPS